MAFFADLLEKANDHLGYDATEEKPGTNEPFFKDNKREVTRFSLGVSGEKGADKYEFAQIRRNKVSKNWEDGTLVEENTDRTKLEMEMDCVGMKFEEQWTRNQYSLGAEKDLVDSDGLKVTGKGEYQHKYGEHDKFSAEMDIETPDMGGVRAFFNLGAERKYVTDGETNKKTAEDEFAAAVNVQIQDDCHVGASWEAEGGETKKMNVQAVYEGYDKTVGWVRADTMNKWVSSGCITEADKFTHTYEAAYGYDESSKTQGIYDSPLWMRIGVKYNLSNASSIVSNYLFAKHWEKNS